MASFASRSFRLFQHYAHEQPVYLWSLGIGIAGPVALVVVPPIRRALGITKPDPIPTSYPLPRRSRREVTGFDDE